MKSIHLVLTVVMLALLQQLSSCKKSNNKVDTGGGTTPVVTITTIATMAGSGTAGYSDGTGAAAAFNGPNGVAVDAQGNVYVADQGNNRIRKITPAGVVTTLAGNGTAGFADGTGTNAKFNVPTRLAVDAAGNIYVADEGNNRIRKVTSTGVVTTLAGIGASGYADGAGANAKFYAPDGIAVDAQGYVYVSDQGNNRIRKVSPAGDVTLFAGNGAAGYTDGSFTTAKFNNPTDVAVDVQGNFYIGDNYNYRIRKITPAGEVSTLAGNGVQGFADGTAASASFNRAMRVAVDAHGIVYVGDQSNHRIRKIDANGMVTTLAGSGVAGFADGIGASAVFNNPSGVAVDLHGNVYVGDFSNNRVRKISFSAK